MTRLQVAENIQVWQDVQEDAAQLVLTGCSAPVACYCLQVRSKKIYCTNLMFDQEVKLTCLVVCLVFCLVICLLICVGV